MVGQLTKENMEAGGWGDMKSLRLGGDFRKPALLLLLLSHPTHLITSRLIHQ